MMRGSNRIIGIGSKRFQYNSLKRLGQAQNDLIFEGFLCIEEPMVPGVAKCISRCKASGIRVILLCREESENNQALAVSMGIAQNASECISIEKIKTMKEDLLRANISIYSMYEGLHNGQQRYIMKWLREDYGYKIGVMGRELDDIALFGEADVAFSEVTTISDKAPRAGVDMSGKDTPLQVKNAKASGRIGCEAVKFVSDVIVSAPDKEGTGGFVSMVSAVENARNIYRNLLMMMRYLLCSQAARALFLVFSMLTGTLLLYPQQILFLGLISDMVAVIVIAFSGPSGETLSGGEDSEKKLSGLWLAGWKYTLLAVFFSISVLLQFPVYERAGTVLNASQKSTVIFFTLLISQFFLLTAMLFRKKGRMTDTRVNTSYLGMLLLLSLFIAALLLFPGFASLFSVTAFPPLCYAGISLSAVLALFLGLIGRVFRKNRTRKNDRRDKLFE